MMKTAAIFIENTGNWADVKNENDVTVLLSCVLRRKPRTATMMFLADF